MGALSAPSNILVAAVEKASNPKTGKYSLLSDSSAANAFSAVLTTGKTHGFPSAVR